MLVVVGGSIFHNVITLSGKKRMMERLISDSPARATHIAVGNYDADYNENSTFIQGEIERNEITLKAFTGDIYVHLASPFKTRVGTGIWRSAGLFDAPSVTAVVDNCDSTTGWTSDSGTVSLETVDFREGVGAVKHSPGNTNTNSFAKNLDAPPVLPGGNTIDDYVQFWYYCKDITKINDMTFWLGNYTGENRYQWFFNATSLTSGWNYISVTFREAVVYGSPDINNLVRFELGSAKISPVIEMIDRIRLWRKSGTLLAVAKIFVDKGVLQSSTVHWYLSAKEGANMAAEPFAKEELTISSLSTLTSSIYAPVGSESAKVAIITVEQSPIRYWIDGSNPTPSSGHLALPGDEPITLDSFKAISLFKCVPVSGTAKLSVTYLR